MSRFISSTPLTDKLTLSEQTDGFWLYDSTQGMNLSTRAKTSTDAFVEALTYYQRRLLKLEKDHSELTSKVDLFVSQFQPD